ncbi:MAG: Gfo/Idh/MocA family oxidoreductase [Firmicutes bacterium]|nr:Gfo/Idh/MocA family oxidoreductase [Bacillota bacterium]
MEEKLNVGIIGCGNISDIYLENCTQVFDNLNVKAVSDLIVERAEEKKEKYEIPEVCTSEELLGDPDIDIVLNLTTPDVHAEIALAALESGKHVYGEKPLTISMDDGKKILSLAGKKGLKVGCAPDTFLGGGLQTCRKLIDDGWIGEPVAAEAFMVCHGHESWHPDPEFYYKVGGGPMFDMGPYYLTALVSLMGPISRVTGSARITNSERTITSEAKYGQKIEVDIPTHVAGVMDFENGVVATIITSFDIWDSKLPRIEVHGSLGSLIVPDPNTFGGPIYLKRYDYDKWKQIPLSHGYAVNSRGMGLSDMARAVFDDDKHRANGELAFHVLEAMHGFHIASNSGKHYDMKFKCEQPSALV